MKKHTSIIHFTLICIISISLFLNLMHYKTYTHAKNSFTIRIYTNLLNVSKCLSNIDNSISVQDTSYILSTLEKNCIELDTLIYGLNTLHSEIYFSYKFEDLNELILNTLASNNDHPEKTSKTLNQYNSEILALIKALSPNQQLVYSEYGELLIKPSYLCSTSYILNTLNASLENILKPSF